ncbi:MAG TPA: hypothetical protein VMR14_23925 [Streptosporangiaceae bacterium]|jgi:hypothetical protein|nr:hypothetical protein [Streptosporangiaceae bacterium]
MSLFQQGLSVMRTADLEHLDATPTDRPAGDNEAHAPGRICAKCGHLIEAAQPARKRRESDWVHETCPE